MIAASILLGRALAPVEFCSTTFVVTHRTGVLRVADSVMVMVDGMLKANGPRETVLGSMLRKVDSTALPGAPA